LIDDQDTQSQVPIYGLQCVCLQSFILPPGKYSFVVTLLVPDTPSPCVVSKASDPPIYLRYTLKSLSSTYDRTQHHDDHHRDPSLLSSVAGSIAIITEPSDSQTRSTRTTILASFHKFNLPQRHWLRPFTTHHLYSGRHTRLGEHGLTLPANKGEMWTMEVVVANAGMMESKVFPNWDVNGSLMEPEEAYKLVDVTLKGTMKTLRLALLNMRSNTPSSRGSVVLVSSISGYFGSTGMSPPLM